MHIGLTKLAAHLVASWFGRRSRCGRCGRRGTEGRGDTLPFALSRRPSRAEALGLVRTRRRRAVPKAQAVSLAMRALSKRGERSRRDERPVRVLARGAIFA